MGDDLIFDLLVGGLRDDLLDYQIALGAIRTVVDDLLCVSLADPGQGIELLLACRVDVELLGGCSRGFCGFGGSRSGARLCYGELAGGESQNQNCCEYDCPELSHLLLLGVDPSLANCVRDEVDGQHVSRDHDNLHSNQVILPAHLCGD